MKDFDNRTIYELFTFFIRQPCWNGYADSFHAVTPSALQELNREAASWLFGEVADLGCGAGKQIPCVSENQKVTRYTGVDMSKKMTKKARWMARQFPHIEAQIITDRIENVSFGPVDSIVSINSYYSWPKPEMILSHANRNLKENGVFVLATVNNQLNMERLLKTAKADLISHPNWFEYVKYNLKICKNPNYRFVSLDTLIRQVQTHGFEVLDAHTRFYQGGLSFLVLKK